MASNFKLEDDTQSCMEVIESLIEQLLNDHSQKLNDEDLERDVRIILDYVKRCNAGEIEYTLLLESIGVDVLIVARDKLKQAAHNQHLYEDSHPQVLTPKGKTASDYYAACHEISVILDELLLS